MAAVGGIYRQRADAQVAANELIAAGVAPSSLHFQSLTETFDDVLGPLGIPKEAVEEYEKDITPGDTLLLVETNALPASAIADEIARTGGLAIEFGWAPSTGWGSR